MSCHWDNFPLQSGNWNAFCWDFLWIPACREADFPTGQNVNYLPRVQHHAPRSVPHLHSLTHTNQTQAANLAWLSEQKQQNDPDLFVLWACSFGAGHHVGPCFQGNHWDAEHILCYPTLQDALGIFFFPPLRICWRHQSEIICRTWLALISIYKYVILPRSRGDYLNLGWNELQEIHGTAN